MEDVTVLMTCVGGQLAPWLLKTLKASDRLNFRTIGVDSSTAALGRNFSDHFYQVPNGDDDGYAEHMLRLCRSESVEVLFPTSDEEALALAFHQEDFAREGIKVSCPPADMVPILRNKADMYDHLAGHGISVPEYHRVTTSDGLRVAAEALGYPNRDFLVKPTVARGGRGVWIISARKPTMAERNAGLAVDALDLETFLESAGVEPFQELMVMPFLSGDMFDVDVLADQSGNAHYLTPRHRYHVRTTPFRGCWLDPHPGVTELASKAQQVLKMPNLFDYDIILDGDGKPWILEVNPRMSASIAVSMMHGIHLPEFAVLMLLGQPVPQVDIPWGKGAKPYFDLVPVFEGPTN